MDPRKQARLESAGWKFGTAEDFLGLTEQERAYVNLKLGLSDCLKASRLEAGLTQHELAKRMNSSQSRVAKMESCDPTVSVDLLVRALYQAGVTNARLAVAIAESGAKYG